MFADFGSISLHFAMTNCTCLQGKGVCKNMTFFKAVKTLLVVFGTVWLKKV